MAKTAQPSRFNPAHLASRHGGAFFLIAALGLSCGLAARALLEPSRYSSEAELSLSVVPAESAGSFDWDAKRREWRGILIDSRERTLLGANLRYVLKLAVVHDLAPDPGRLDADLAGFEPARAYSSLLLPGPVAARLGPDLVLSRRDLAANLDFQSLAAIVADLDPPKEAEKWDFSFFRTGADGAERGMEGFMITRPGPEDRFFRVFYHLYSISNAGREARTPEDAWRAAADEVAERLDREAEFAGGGGFGPRARRELVREIAAIPALAANSLYHATGWPGGDSALHDQISVWTGRWTGNIGLDLTHSTPSAGRLEATAELDLYPLAFPRDTVLTRLPPLMVSTLLAYISARENALPAPMAEPPVPAPGPAPEPVAVMPEPAPPPVTKIVAVVPDEDLAKHRTKVRELEDSLQRARLAHADAARRLDAARDREKRLTMEALAARARADRLRERFDEALSIPVAEPEPGVPPETLKLLLARDEILERLAGLLEHCTEEHPFVRQTRRDLAAVEALLAGRERPPRPAAEKPVDARLAGLRLEWETASASADGLEERRRRQTAEADAALAALAPAEKRLADLESGLARLRDNAPKQERIAVSPAPPPAPAMKPPPPPPPAAEPPRALPPTPAFSGVPGRIPLVRFAPSWETPIKGLLLGLVLGLLWTLAREILASRFANANEARRMVAYPVLAVLPAYDAKSFRNAAKAAKGELSALRSERMAFTPSPVELIEPQPAGRRGKLAPARRRRRLLAGALGLLILAGGVALHLASRNGFAQPVAAFRGELAPPPATAYDLLDPEDEGGEWGDLP